MSELHVDRLSVEYDAGQGFEPVVDDVSFSLAEGERLGIAGESGSGKSTVLLTILGLVASAARVSGRIRWDDRDLLDCGERELCEVRGREIGLIPQAAINSLNPVASVGHQLAEVLPDAGGRRRRRTADARVAKLLDDVGLADTTRDRYPHELSGGMRQRVIIAMALAQQPRLLLADEPTTALDVLVQAEVLDVLLEVCGAHRISLVFVSHELAVLGAVTQRMLVMHRGKIVEQGTTAQIFGAAEHPYTRKLVAAARGKGLAGVTDG